MSLLDHDAWEIAAAVRSGEASATEVTESALERLGADSLGAVWLVTAERARAEAAAVDATLAAGRDPGPLAGVPVGWKDLIDTAGIRTTYGSAIYADHVPDRDADVVSRHTAAGAITVAKLATHEFGLGHHHPESALRRMPKPSRPDQGTGGLERGLGRRRRRGHGAARARVPTPADRSAARRRAAASWGSSPPLAASASRGIHPLCFSLDHCGPMARSVRDCALSLEVMAGPSARDPRTPRCRWSAIATPSAWACGE